MSLIQTPEGLQGMGLIPGQDAKARQAWDRSGSPPRFTSASFDDSTPTPAAFSLAYLILWWFNQGPVGSCFANAAVSAVHLSIAFASQVLGLALGETQLSRAWIWYWGRKLDGLLGYPTDGGSITNALRAFHEAGVCPEELLPYTDGKNQPYHRWLEQTPNAKATAGAKAYGLKGLVDLRFSDTEGIKRSVMAGCPPVIGIWWPFGWDGDTVDQYGRTIGIGRGVFGHALVIVGWVVWDGRLYWQILNSHGAIYGLPPEEVRRSIPGYASARPDRCYTFFVRDDYLQTVAGYGNAEIVAPVGPYSPDSRSPATWISGLS